MRNFFTLVSAVIFSACLWAQAPQNFSYQAVVRGENNVLISNKPVGMKVSLLQGSENGSSIFVETHKPTSNENGLVSIAIGSGTKVSGDFATIDWSKGPYFLKTETDPTGGTSYSLSSVSQLLSVPYALFAANSQPGPKGDKGDPGKDGVDGKDEQKLSVSPTGDTLYLTNGNFVIIPGLSAANPKTKPTSGYGPNITDVEGNSYKTVYIGTQQWMAENLKVSKYSDGTNIPNVTDNTQWSQLTTGGWAYYNNDAANNAKYGKLYNWYAVSPTTNGDKNVCPTGWHVPTDAEWTVLTDYLGGLTVAGGKLKEVGTTNWNSPNTDATNESLFSALPGDTRDIYGNYYNIGRFGLWWSSTANNTDYAWHLELYTDVGNAYRNSRIKRAGLSVRCLKD